MLLSDIFDTACALISEDSTTANARELRERAPSLLRAVSSELICVQRMINDGEVNVSPESYSSLDNIFPLDEPLGYLCALKLGSLLCADENAALSKRLLAEYETGRERFIASLPAVISGIKDVYS